MLAAVWANYKIHEFLELEGELQSLIVAAYQTNLRIESVLTNEQIKEARRKARMRK